MGLFAYCLFSSRYVQPVRAAAFLLASLLVLGCTGSPEDPSSTERQRDTIAQFQDGTPRTITIARNDTVLERRTYRPTGRLERIESGDSVQTYFELHEPDSSEILRDYLQGRWKNLSADTAQNQASAFYRFEPEKLTFENPSGKPLESLGIEYQDQRTLATEHGMSVQAQITSFDTVRVTGYTLVRLPPDSL